ncbi:cation:proton antiporter domain-containing protein [Erythrobacter rubeus]|uniref:Cation:proton antiporter n=1 Tax=Erythrobacter rubeus TaxID=2760803 RepID=A0ABR8KWY3_9SPHN|nr:cation:proton antiporter [Erythrobacter rubeus]MBD2842727.1 cation:proton antiporter [Erythrobacter rubeus]
MESHVHIPFLREVLVFLLAAGVAVPLLQRFISPVIGYFIVGSIIGPFGLGLLADIYEPVSYLVITDVEGVTVLAELGVIFLLFVIGLELSFERLWAMRRLVFGLGSAQILVTGAVIAAVAVMWGNATATAIILGACLALSSTAIVTQLLIEGGRLGTPSGRATFSILLMQDLAVVPILFAVSVLGTMAVGNVALGFGLAVGEALLVIALIYAAGRLLLRPLLQLVAGADSREAFVGIILLIAVGTAAITGFAGLSMALGAFLAGLLIAETEFRHQVKIDIEPFKGLMLGLFFLSVGMGIDWRMVIDSPILIIASAISLVLLKVAINFALCLAWRLPRHRAAEVAIMLGQAGEFGFLVIGLSVTVGLFPSETGQFMLIVVGLTMLATPGLDWLARRVGSALEHDGEDAGFEETSWATEMGGHVILAGYGRVGATIAGVLDRQDIRYVAIDSDPELARKAASDGRPVRMGDASRLEVLREAGLDKAAAVVVTIGDKDATEALTHEINRLAPRLPILARARDASHADKLLDDGANVAVPETIEGSLRLAEMLLMEFGIDGDIANRAVEMERPLKES